MSDVLMPEDVSPGLSRQPERQEADADAEAVRLQTLVHRIPWPAIGAASSEDLLSREWLVTNGLGGYASGSVAGAITRRYHALLIAALPAPLGRVAMLSHLAERLRFADRSVTWLGVHQSGGRLTQLEGAQHLVEFRLEAGLPVWRYQINDSVIEKSLLLVHNQNTLHVRYTLLHGSGSGRGDDAIRLGLRPLVNFRPHDAPVNRPLATYTVAATKGRVALTDDTGLPALHMAVRGRNAAFTLDSVPIADIRYATEAERGYDSEGESFSPGYFRADLTADAPVTLVASVEPWDIVEAIGAEQAWQAERARRARLIAIAHPEARTGPAAELVLAADQFIITPAARADDAPHARADTLPPLLRERGQGVRWPSSAPAPNDEAPDAARRDDSSRPPDGQPPSPLPTETLAGALADTLPPLLRERGQGVRWSSSAPAPAPAPSDEARTIIAGYHWFTDWGRDTMISLEGLTLLTGRHREAGDILRTFAQYVRDGLIPNMFPEHGNEGLYHTADATLWFFHALDRYVAWTGDDVLLNDLRPTLLDIVDHHLRGTHFNIRVDPNDGLLTQGADGYQLTWMDAKVGDWVVTPRRGKAVEINALWYNALRLLEGWTRDAGDHDNATRLCVHADRAVDAFNRRFWNDAAGCLFDVIDGDADHDAACRPNQLMAIALHHPVLDRARWEPVLDTVRDRLLTPVGLRSLAPGHPDYKARYFGDLRARDAAYHQGTVWAWLIGPFVDAWLAQHPHDTAGARACLQGFVAHLDQACIGSISEVFDADAPFTPRGCIAQAWSVAEVLRAWIKTSSSSAADTTGSSAPPTSPGPDGA
jgi:glycogen debranching enzyme